MQALPHNYTVSATGKPDENLQVSIANLPCLAVAPPEQFGGPGNVWSPEDLFIASIASCFILSFRAIAKASKLNWLSIDCGSEGVLDKLEGKTQFTKVITTATLLIPATESIDKAELLLHKAEKSCLVINSLITGSALKCEINVAA
tara:strand:+ start:37497 stop:37934 length:438 start_codon:yes stop_codon:yes gene_type:complete